MFKKTLLAGFMISVVAGCASIPGMESATVDRNQLSTELQKQCNTMGTEFTKFNYAVDKISTVMVALQERQCGVLGDYRVMASKHADVIGFLDANQDKSDEELNLAVDAFDAKSTKKIRPLVEAYKSASDAIAEKNLALITDVGLQIAEVALLVTDHGPELAQVILLETLGNLATVDTEELTPIEKAYVDIKLRAALIYDADTLISMDKDLIEQLDNLDKQISEEVKS